MHIKKPTFYFKIMHQNICRLNCNFNNFGTLLARLNFECDIIVLPECWLSQVSNFYIRRTYSYNTDNTFNQNDGFVVYVKKAHYL